MKFSVLLVICLLLSPSLAFAGDDRAGEEKAVMASSWTTTVIRADAAHSHKIGKRLAEQAKPLQSTPSSPQSSRTRRLAALRSWALATSMEYLPRLRPYASNYPRMVDDVRQYWHHNTARPDAQKLTEIILRHVKFQYRFLARPQVLAGARKGVARLKRRLRKS